MGEFEGEGYVEKPDTREVQSTDMFCYRESARPCDSTCMAYLIEMPDGPDYQGQEWSRCLVLVNEHRQGKHLTVLAGEAVTLRKHLKIKADDATRIASSGAR